MTSSNRAVARQALALTAVLLLARLWFVIHRVFDVDELEHAHAAWSLSQGLIPYRDFFEHHPPALYLLAAPIYARFSPSVDSHAAVSLLLGSRAVMWVLMVAAVGLVYLLGTLWRDRLTGALAAALLMTSVQFANVMIEFRPDGAAVVCVLAALVCALPSRDGIPPSWRRLLLAGIAFGSAILFTQKALFAAPGLLVAAIVCRPGRSLPALAVGFAIPVTLVVAWFASHGAGAALVEHTVLLNSQLNADRTTPFPRLLTHVALNPALYGLGVAGILRARRGMRARDTILVAAVLSLLAGIFIIGRTYDQYYALVLAVLSLFAAEAAVAIGSRLQMRHATAVTGTALAAAGIISVVTLVITFESSARQIADLDYVMQASRPDETVLSGVPGAGTFRPHAWFYFFLSGPFATDRDYADLASALDAGRIRPRFVILDRRVAEMPVPILTYINSHYRRARGDIFERVEPVR